jgi:hypothetical protein
MSQKNTSATMMGRTGRRKKSMMLETEAADGMEAADGIVI